MEAAEHGLRQSLDALRGSDDETAQKFMAKYDSIAPSDLVFFSIEQIAASCGVDTPTLAGVLMKAIVSQQASIAAIKAATAHPKIVEKSIQNALQDRGIRDREMLHTAVGFLPTPKGATIISQRFQIANISNPEKTKEVEGPASLSQFDDDIRGLHEMAMHGKPLELPDGGQ